MYAREKGEKGRDRQTNLQKSVEEMVEGASLFNPTSVSKYGRQIKNLGVKILQRCAQEVGPKLYNRMLVGSLTPTRMEIQL